MKSFEDYDRCMVVYHKCSDQQGVLAADIVYMVSHGGVYFKGNLPQFLLR